LLNFV
jgi:peroxiredoxin